MKKSLVLAAFLVSMIAVACKNETKPADTAAPAATESSDAKTYACPMECEGEKTYTEPGQCPECKMDLEVVTK